MSHVRLPLVGREFLMTCVETEPLIREDQQCKELLLEAMKYHLLPEQRSLMTTQRTLYVTYRLAWLPLSCLRNVTWIMLILHWIFRERRPDGMRTYMFAVGKFQLTGYPLLVCAHILILVFFLRLYFIFLFVPNESFFFFKVAAVCLPSITNANAIIHEQIHGCRLQACCGDEVGPEWHRWGKCFMLLAGMSHSFVHMPPLECIINCIQK